MLGTAVSQDRHFFESVPGGEIAPTGQYCRGGSIRVEGGGEHSCEKSPKYLGGAHFS